MGLPVESDDGASQRDALEESWKRNAEPWIDFMQRPLFHARRSVTFDAMLTAVAERCPTHVLDLGCGEGWLCRALHDRGIKATGLDASEHLIYSARQHEGSSYINMKYDQVVAGALTLLAPVDLIAANFSLLDDQVSPLATALSEAALPSANLIIQAVHPFGCAGDYRSGWRLEMFAGHGDQRFRPMPWYFRTLASWSEELAPRWRMTSIAEPREKGSRFPASILITASRT